MSPKCSSMLESFSLSSDSQTSPCSLGWAEEKGINGWILLQGQKIVFTIRFGFRKCCNRTCEFPLSNDGRWCFDAMRYHLL